MALKSIKVVLPEGDAHGLIMAWIEQWVGIAFKSSRDNLKQLLNHEKLQSKHALYILLGESKTSESQDGDEGLMVPTAYIGISEDICSRLRYHASKKKDDANHPFPEWDQVCVFTQRDDDLTINHLKYLESKMIKIAMDASRINLTNKQKKNSDKIVEPSDETISPVMGCFIEHAQILLPLLGIDWLKPQPLITNEDSTPTSPLFIFNYSGAEAKAKIIDNEFVVLAGAKVREKAANSIPPKAQEQRMLLIEKGILKKKDDYYELSKNHAFNTPSAAAGFVGAGSISGPKYWKLKDEETTYAEWQESQISEETE